MAVVKIYLCVVLIFAGLTPANTETAFLLLLGYAGIITHYVKKWSDTVEREELFKIKKSIPSIILSCITTTVLIVLRDDLEAFIVFTKFTAFMVGYFGNSWFFGYIETRFNNNIKTPVQNEND